MNVVKTENRGTVKEVNETVASNGNELWQIVVNTASAGDISSLKETDNITDFILVNSERTEYTCIMPRIKGVTTEQFAASAMGKFVDIITFKVSIKELSKGQVSRIRYTRKDGTTNITSTLARTYVKGSPNAVAEVALEAMHDELLTKLDQNIWEVFKEEQQQQQQQQQPPKFTF